jgi:hypothetical protein
MDSHHHLHTFYWSCRQRLRSTFDTLHSVIPLAWRWAGDEVGPRHHSPARGCKRPSRFWGPRRPRWVAVRDHNCQSRIRSAGSPFPPQQQRSNKSIIAKSMIFLVVLASESESDSNSVQAKYTVCAPHTRANISRCGLGWRQQNQKAIFFPRILHPSMELKPVSTSSLAGSLRLCASSRTSARAALQARCSTIFSALLAPT